jgi:hypothetical protein
MRLFTADPSIDIKTVSLPYRWGGRPCHFQTTAGLRQITYLGYHFYHASRHSSPALSMVVEALRYIRAERSSSLL